MGEEFGIHNPLTQLSVIFATAIVTVGTGVIGKQPGPLLVLNEVGELVNANSTFAVGVNGLEEFPGQLPNLV